MLNLDPRLYVDPAVLPRERTEILPRTRQMLGPSAPRHEQGVHYFQERVKESLGAMP
jgi:hypothetical protein